MFLPSVVQHTDSHVDLFLPPNYTSLPLKPTWRNIHNPPSRLANTQPTHSIVTTERECGLSTTNTTCSLHRRGLKEVSHIWKSNSDLNTEWGRHYLTRSYDRLVLQRDSIASMGVIWPIQRSQSIRRPNRRSWDFGKIIPICISWTSYSSNILPEYQDKIAEYTDREMGEDKCGLFRERERQRQLWLSDSS